MKLYNFTRLIQKYSVPFCLHRSQGAYVGGKWEPGGEIVQRLFGAIVLMKDHKIYSSGGTYTQQDRELYLTTPLKAPLSDYRVVYKGNTYAVEEGRNFEDYADVAVYVLKRVSGVNMEHD